MFFFLFLNCCYLRVSLKSFYFSPAVVETEAGISHKRPRTETEAKEEYEEWKRRILENAAKSQKDDV